jgi:hypothetical protein
MDRPVRIARTAEEASTLLDGERLCKVAASLNEGVRCIIDKVKYSGQEHAILRLLFENNQRWAVRLPINPNGNFSNDSELPLTLMRATVSLQHCLHKHGVMVPRVHWSCLQWNDNPVGYPAVIMDWIEGQALDWKIIRHHSEAKAKILAQLADYIFSLLTLTESHEVLQELQALQPDCEFPISHLRINLPI